MCNSGLNYELIGEKIKKIRKNALRNDGRPLTQEEFIEKTRICIKPRTLGAVERGEEDAIKGRDFDFFSKVADFAGVSIGYILGEYDSSTREIQDIHDVTGLSENAIKELISIKKAETVFKVLFGENAKPLNEYEIRYGEGKDSSAYLEEIEKHGYTMENFFTKNPRKALYLLVSSLDKWCTFRGIKHDYLANVNDPSTLRLAFIDYLLTGERKFGEIYGEYPLLDALCAYAFNLSSYSIPDGTFLFKNKQSSFQMIDVQEELRTARTELIKLSKEDESDTLYDMFAPEEKKKK